MSRIATFGLLVGMGIVGCGVRDGAAFCSAQATASASQATTTPSQGPARATPPAREVPPVLKALNEAGAIKDPDEKIAAIRKVIASFPKAPQVSQAHSQLLDALVKKGDLKAIQRQCRAMVDSATEFTKTRTERDVAGALLRANVLLEDAEAYAKSAADALQDEKRYVELRRKEATARPVNTVRPAEDGAASSRQGGAVPAGDEAVLTRFKSERQSALSTLGQIYAKQGKGVEAGRTLREAFLVDRRTAVAATAALKLAEMAKLAGREAEQLEYLQSAALAGRLTPEARADLQSVYRRTHDGSLDGLEESLDALYSKEGPKPPEVMPYERAADRSDRVVLAEVFTGSGCPPCVAADLAFESAMHRYRPEELAVLMYHVHVPRPDPMTNPYTQARSKFYAVPGVPTYVIDGKPKTGGGGAEVAGAIYRRDVGPVIEKRLSDRPEIGLQLSGSSTGDAIRATVSVVPGETTATRPRLHLVLVEEQIRYSGENGIRFHPMVVRSMAGEAAPSSPPAAEAGEASKASAVVPAPVLGFALEPGKARTVEFTFDLARVAADGLANLVELEQHSARFPNYTFAEKRNEVDARRLLLVAFVQDEDTGHVLQAARTGILSSPRGK